MFLTHTLIIRESGLRLRIAGLPARAPDVGSDESIREDFTHPAHTQVIAHGTRSRRGLF